MSSSPRRGKRGLSRLEAVLAGLALIAMVGCAGDEPASNDPPRNVLLITLDTTRADRIGAFGGTAVPTPQLDALADSGVAFSSAISQVPLTLPAHGSILTGRYPAAHGVRHNGLYRLPESEITLGEVFRDAGFETAAFIGAFVLNEQYGTAQGFESYDDVETTRDPIAADNQYEAERSAAQVNERFFDWLGTRESDRWFAWIHYYDPHLPYAAPEHPTRELHGSGYDREISYVDACVGDVVDTLRQSGRLEETLIVIVGDHGESLGEHRELTHGVFLYEAALRVPFLMAGPRVPRGRTVHEPVELVDVAPTIVDLAGLDPLVSAQGRSLTTALQSGSADDTRSVYAETFMPRIEFGWSELLMIRDSRYKYIQAPRPELYDLLEDPAETNNLVEDRWERAEIMSGRLRDWLLDTTATQSDESAEKTLTPEAQEQLLSLGYLGGGQFATTGDAPLPDPKDRIDEGRRLTLARDMTAAGQEVEALKVIEEILDASPTNHLAHTSRMQALIRLNRLEQAERAARAAVEAAQRDAAASPMLEEQARRAHASTLWMVGRRDDAEAEFRAALAANPDTGRTPVFGGLLLGAAGNRQDALRIVETQLERAPRDPHAWAAKFELQHSAREIDAALESAARLAELEAGDHDTLLSAGLLAEEAGERDLALRLLEIAGRKAPSNTEILGRLGTLRLNAGRLDDARQTFEDLLRIEPENGLAAYFLGNIALLGNDEQTARRRFEQALAASPTTSRPLLNLALWLTEMGRPSEAITELERAVRRNPEDPAARQLLTRLRDAEAGGNGG